MDAPLLSINDLKTYFFTAKGSVRAVDKVSLKIGKEEVEPRKL